MSSPVRAAACEACRPATRGQSRIVAAIVAAATMLTTARNGPLVSVMAAPAHRPHGGSWPAARGKLGGEPVEHGGEWPRAGRERYLRDVRWRLGPGQERPCGAGPLRATRARRRAPHPAPGVRTWRHSPYPPPPLAPP